MHIWEIALWVGAPLAVLVLLVWTILTWRSMRKKRQLQEHEVREQQRRDNEEEPHYLAWIEQVEAAATDSEVLAAGNKYYIRYDDDVRRILKGTYSRYEKAYDKFESAFRRQIDSERMARSLKGANQEEVLRAIAKVGRKSHEYSSEIVFNVQQDDLVYFFLEHVRTMLDDTLRAYPCEQNLRWYMSCMDDYEVRWFIRYHDLYSKVYPEDWDDLVDSVCTAPSLSLYPNRAQKSPGAAAIMAAEAIRTDSSKLAKLVLAYCHDDEAYRRAVGEVLQAELIKLVDERNQLNAYDPIPPEAN